MTDPSVTLRFIVSVRVPLLGSSEETIARLEEVQQALKETAQDFDIDAKVRKA